MPSIKYSITKLHIKVLGLISLSAFLIYLFKNFLCSNTNLFIQSKCSFLNVKKTKQKNKQVCLESTTLHLCLLPTTAARC